MEFSSFSADGPRKGMKVLISNAIWGEAYCSIFAKFSLATLLSCENIPKLAKQAAITCHIVTTRRDRRRLLREPAVVELQRYCKIEWELIEDFGIYGPPEGPGGEKYPFLSALQNIAIKRSSDHDVIVFNYADFIWADGSLTHAVEMLLGGRKPLDAVFSFCLPVDRDSAIRALDRHRQTGSPGVIQLAPRNGAKIAIEHMHREAKVRFWDSPRFTVTPSYIIWQVEGQGLLIRAYHQSILAMRVRKNDPQYLQGILRGSLDSSFAAQLAKSTSLAFATDTDKVLIFSLYHTPVDSRLPLGVTREMSLRSLLAGDVTPEQRPFAERPIFLRLGDDDEILWNHVAEKSWNMLRNAQDTTPFDQTTYDKNLETHGMVPNIARLSFLSRHATVALGHAYRLSIRYSEFTRRFAAPFVRNSEVEKFVRVLRQPSQLWNSTRLQWLIAIGNRGKSIAFVLHDPALLRAALRRRLVHSVVSNSRYLRFVVRNPRIFFRALKQSLQPLWDRGDGFEIVPNLWVDADIAAHLGKAIVIEDSAASATDDVHFISTLRTAEEMLRKTIKSAPVWVVPRRALGRNLWFQGRFEAAMQHFAEAEQLRDVMAWVAGWPVDSCVFLPRNCTESIGLMGHLDAFAKHKILTADPRPYYLIAPPENVINAAFFSYWRDYFTIVSKGDEIDRLAPFEPAYSVDWNWAMPQDGKIVFVHEGVAAVQRAWQGTGRSPLLRLRQEHADALSRVRTKWGMKEEQRFVCLHVRSGGFYGESREHAQRFRNTSIEHYYPLIRTLVEMDLWVIRMGDPSMHPLDLAQCGASGGGVVDYAHSSDKSAELDVALCAQCELFVSSPSGLHSVAHAFGRPVCEVNYPIYPGFPWHPDDIFIPQLYYSSNKGRVLSLREILGSDTVYRDHHFLLERAGISLLPNQPDDIIETVREALSPSTYHVSDAALADRVCAAFDELNDHYDLGISGRLGRYFAMKYAAQLLPTEHQRGSHTDVQLGSSTTVRATGPA